MPKGQPVSGRLASWNDSTEKRLLLLIITGGKDWVTIARKMGSSFSASACQQKFAKLKKAIETEFPDDGGQQGATPRKRGSAGSKTSTKKGNITPDDSEDGDEDEVDEVVETRPSKKPKKEESGNIIVKSEPQVLDIERDDLYCV